MVISLFSKNNERLARGLNYDSFTSLAGYATDRFRTEAMGFGTNEEGKIGAFGSTGKSGVSCARTANGAIGYLNPGGTFYIIDTTKLPNTEKAWDMKSNMHMDGDNGNNSRLETLQSRVSWDKDYTIRFNPEYKA